MGGTEDCMLSEANWSQKEIVSCLIQNLYLKTKPESIWENGN